VYVLSAHGALVSERKRGDNVYFLCGRDKVRTCQFCGEPASHTPIGDVCARCLESYTKEDEMENQGIEKAIGMIEAMGKVKPGETVFVLRAQDITAHVVVEAWVAIQQSIKQAMDDGATMTEAIENARQIMRVPRVVTMLEEATEKERGALEIAQTMMRWDNRKLAD
jgi:hypothetical protein